MRLLEVSRRSQVGRICLRVTLDLIRLRTPVTPFGHAHKLIPIDLLQLSHCWMLLVICLCGAFERKHRPLVSVCSQWSLNTPSANFVYSKLLTWLCWRPTVANRAAHQRRMHRA